MKANDTVEIQGPAIEQLHRKKSCLKRTCFTGLGCLTIFILSALLVFNLLVGPKKINLDKLPASVHEKVVLYDIDFIESIKKIDGSEKHPVLESFAMIPKVILGPIILSLEERPAASNISFLHRFSEFLDQPISSDSDSYIVSWKDRPADPDFIAAYYADELRKKGFSVSGGKAGYTLVAEQDDIAIKLKLIRGPQNTTSEFKLIIDTFHR